MMSGRRPPRADYVAPVLRVILLAMCFLCSTAGAKTDTVVEAIYPDIQGSTRDLSTITKTGMTLGGVLAEMTNSPRFRFGDSGDQQGEFFGWLQFTIPEQPGLKILSASLHFSGLRNEVAEPGLALGRVEDDWNAESIFHDRYSPSETISAYSDFPDQFQVDVTHLILDLKKKILPGKKLSIRGSALRGGHRRAYTDEPVKLIVEFLDIEEAQRRKEKQMQDAGMAIIIPDVALIAVDQNGRLESSQSDAADRLQLLIERGGGPTIPILSASDKVPDSIKRIFVGYGPHLHGVVEPPSKPEGVKIAELKGELFLLGEIAETGTNNWPEAVDRGIRHAVSIFAEEVLGYRFIFAPMDSMETDPDAFALGTVIPELESFEIPSDLLIEEAPVFSHRLTHGHFSRDIPGLRAGSSTAFAANHSYNIDWYARQYAAQYPQMFIPKEPDDSEEARDRAEAMGEQRHLNFLDYTEPKVLESRVQHYKEFFRTGFSAPFHGRVPNDKYLQEEPPDTIPPSVEYNKRSRELYNPRAEPWGVFSNIWFDYLNRLSAQVKDHWPEKRIATLAYYRHYGIPTFELADNIDVMLALMRSSTQNKQPYVFERNLRHVKNWSAKLGNDRERLLLWEYWCWPGFFVTPPTIAPYAMQDWLQAVQPYVSGVFINTGGHPLQFEYLMQRLWMRMLWNPEIDIDAEIQDLTRRFYGPAGGSINSFYRLLIDRYEMEWKGAGAPIWQQYYATPNLYYGQSYRKKEILQLASLLEEARKLVGLPAVLQADVQHGSAIYLVNVEATPLTVELNFTAVDSEIVNPTVGWADGSERLSWQGRLKPGERLTIRTSGTTVLSATDGSEHDVSDLLRGTLPVLEPEQAETLHFWHFGPTKDASFLAEVNYGCDAWIPGSKPSGGIEARRLLWMRDPYLVFHPTQSAYAEKRGFFPEASVVHRHLGKTPQVDAVKVATLPRKLDSELWESIPSVELVKGRESGGPPYEIYGFPADFRTKVKILHADEGLVFLVEAEGEATDEENFAIRLGEQDFSFAVGINTKDPDEASGATFWEWKPAVGGWKALAVIPWKVLDLPEPTPASDGATFIPLQMFRQRGETGYLWSPAMGSPWRHDQQGPGRLILRD